MYAEISCGFPLAHGLLAWAIGVSLFLGPILAANAFADARRLRHERIPRPWLVIARRIIGLFPLPSTGAVMVGRRVFVSWDVRWLAAGVTTGRVLSVDPVTREIALALDDPVAFLDATNDVHQLVRATFVPRSKRTPYSLASVSGTLRPDLRNAPDTTTAVLVVYRD